MIGVVAGILITLVSWILLSFVFPDSLSELRQAAIDHMEANDFPEDEYQRQLQSLDAATPLSQSIPGGIGTLGTSLVTGLISALFLRKK